MLTTITKRTCKAIISRAVERLANFVQENAGGTYGLGGASVGKTGTDIINKARIYYGVMIGSSRWNLCGIPDLCLAEALQHEPAKKAMLFVTASSKYSLKLKILQYEELLK